MNSPSHNSLICTCFHLSALEFTYIRLVSPICTCLTHMLYPHLGALSFGYVRLTSIVDSLFHLYALSFPYTPLSLHQCALLVTFQHFSSAIYALVFTYMLLLSLMCSFQTVFSLILVFWSATYSGGSAVLNFCCKSVHDYNHEFTLQKHWHSSLKLCQ